MLVDIPLRPTPGQARGWLAAELSKPSYEKRGLFDRLSEGLDRFLSRLSEAGAALNWVRLTALLLTFAALLAVIIWLVTRVRGSARVADRTATPVFQTGFSAADHLAQARARYAAGEHAAAVVAAFRSLAARAVEAGLIDERPSSTAHEITGQLLHAWPAEGERIRAVGELFDEAAYGDRPISAEQARQAVELAAREPVAR